VIRARTARRRLGAPTRSRALRWLLAALRETAGASLVEYIVIVGVVALLALFAFSTFGDDANGGLANAGADVAKLGF
jgi:Flp pilus assembly pilin Flp